MSTDALHSSPLYHESSSFLTQTALPQNGAFNKNTDSVTRSISSPAYNRYQSHELDEYPTTTFGQSPKHTPPSPRVLPPQPHPRRVKNTASQPELKIIPTGGSMDVQQSGLESPKPLPRKLKSATTQPQLSSYGAHSTDPSLLSPVSKTPPQPLPRKQVPQSPGPNSPAHVSSSPHQNPLSPNHVSHSTTSSSPSRVFESPAPISSPARMPTSPQPIPQTSSNHVSQSPLPSSPARGVFTPIETAPPIPAWVPSVPQSPGDLTQAPIPNSPAQRVLQSPIVTTPPIPARVPSVPYTTPQSPGDFTQFPIPNSPARGHQTSSSNSPTHLPPSPASKSPANSPPLSRGIEQQPYNRMSATSPTLLLQPSSPPPTNVRQSLPIDLQARYGDSVFHKNNAGAANTSVGGAGLGSQHRLSAPPLDCPTVSITSEESSSSGESGHTTPDQSHTKRYSRSSQSSEQSTDLTKLSLAYLSPSRGRKGSQGRVESPPPTRFSGYDIMDLFTGGNVLMFIPQGDPHKSPIKVDGGKLKGGGSFLSCDSMFEIIIPRQSLDRIIMLRNCSHKNNYIAINKKGKIGIHHGKAGKCEFNVRVQEQFTSPVVCLESAQCPGWFLAMTPKGAPGDPVSVGTTLESQFIVRGHKLANSHFNSSVMHMIGKRSAICRLQDRCVTQLCSKVSSKYLGIDKKGRMLETDEKDPLSYFIVYDHGLGIISLQSYKNGSHWLRIQNFEIQGKGRPDLNTDLIIQENIDGSVSLESVVSPGSYIASYSGGDASDPSMATKARTFALGFVQNVKIK